MRSGTKRLSLVRGLLRTRRKEIALRLAGAVFGETPARLQGDVLSTEWRLGDGHELFLVANLSLHPAQRPGAPCGRPIFGGTPPPTLPLWSVFWSIGERA